MGLRRARWERTLIAGLASLLLLLAGPVGSTIEKRILGFDSVVRVDFGLVAQGQDELAATANAVARAWAAGADQVVARHLIGGRVRLHLDGSVSASLPNRQASAALREYLRGYQAGQIEIARVSLVDGPGTRGFVELRWTAQRMGTSQALRRTVFLGFWHDGRSWVVDEVRIMY